MKKMQRVKHQESVEFFRSFFSGFGLEAGGHRSFLEGTGFNCSSQMDGASLVAIQATIAMRPVKRSIQPATSVQPAKLALYSSLAAPVPAPTQNTLFLEGAIAVRREFSSILPEVP